MKSAITGRKEASIDEDERAVEYENGQTYLKCGQKSQRKGSDSSQIVAYITER
jgi:hypothetical protein